ncbi:MAG: NAD(P)-binding domain-containing protein [Kiloniellales bacterium]
MTMTKIGFIGLGAMGSGMVRNLMKGGFSVAVYDLVPALVDRLAEEGARATRSPREAAEGAELVIAMLPNAADIDAALDGPDGVLASAETSRLFMNCSSINPLEAIRLAEKAGLAGWRYVDCAVGRTATQAAQGKCLFMIGGAEADKLAVRPALDQMGDTVIDGGEIGRAATLKIVNNYLALVSCLATAEALAIAKAMGLTPSAALEVINGTTARNGNTELNFPNKVLRGDVSPGFPLMHGHKDLSIAIDLIGDVGVSSYLGRPALKAFADALERGHGRNDCSDILNMLEAGETGSKEGANE